MVAMASPRCAWGSGRAKRLSSAAETHFRGPRRGSIHRLVKIDAAPRDARLSWLAVAFGATLCASTAELGADSRWLAALGRTIVHAGAIPASIPYAAAPSRDWVNVPALGEIVFHWLEAMGGDRGLLLAQAVAVTAALVFVFRDMRAFGAPDAARALVLGAIPFAAIPAVFVA